MMMNNRRTITTTMPQQQAGVPAKKQAQYNIARQV